MGYMHRTKSLTPAMLAVYLGVVGCASMQPPFKVVRTRNLGVHVSDTEFPLTQKEVIEGERQIMGTATHPRKTEDGWLTYKDPKDGKDYWLNCGYRERRDGCNFNYLLIRDFLRVNNIDSVVFYHNHNRSDPQGVDYTAHLTLRHDLAKQGVSVRSRIIRRNAVIEYDVTDTLEEQFNRTIEGGGEEAATSLILNEYKGIVDGKFGGEMKKALQEAGFLYHTLRTSKDISKPQPSNTN